MKNHFGQPLNVGDELVHVANSRGGLITRRCEILKINEKSVQVKYLTGRYGSDWGVGQKATLQSSQRLFPIPEGL